MKKLFPIVILAIFIVSGSCVSTSFKTKNMRKAELVPAAFITTEGMELDGTSCKSPLIDPNDGTEIILVESIKGVGDYQVPKGKYGVNVNELLRIDCKTGEVLGIVEK